MNPKTNLFKRVLVTLGVVLMLMQGWTASAQGNARVVKGKIIDEENFPLAGV